MGRPSLRPHSSKACWSTSILVCLLFYGRFPARQRANDLIENGIDKLVKISSGLLDQAHPPADMILLRPSQSQHELTLKVCPHVDPVFVCLFPYHLLHFSQLLQLPPIHNSDPASHSGHSSPPSSLRCVPSLLSRKESDIFFPRRLASKCALYTFLFKAISVVIFAPENRGIFGRNYMFCVVSVGIMSPLCPAHTHEVPLDVNVKNVRV